VVPPSTEKSDVGLTPSSDTVAVQHFSAPDCSVAREEVSILPATALERLSLLCRFLI
jgi:hypothetical protein